MTGSQLLQEWQGIMGKDNPFGLSLCSDEINLSAGVSRVPSPSYSFGIYFSSDFLKLY